MKVLYTHTVFNSLVVSWVLHMLLRSIGTDPGMAFSCLAVATLLILSFPGYVRRQLGDK